MKRKFNKEENPKITKRNTKLNYKNYIEFNREAAIAQITSRAAVGRMQESLLFVRSGVRGEAWGCTALILCKTNYNTPCC